MATAEDDLMDWLRDAHAMEEQAEQILSGQAKRIEHYPHLRAAIERHLEETREQARRVRQCIERRGGDTSTLKDATAKVVAFGQNLSGMFASDEVVKGALASYAFEHMEIASYKALILATQEIGEPTLGESLKEVLAEEEAMAQWLDSQLPAIVREAVTQGET